MHIFKSSIKGACDIMTIHLGIMFVRVHVFKRFMIQLVAKISNVNGVVIKSILLYAGRVWDYSCYTMFAWSYVGIYIIMMTVL